MIVFTQSMAHFLEQRYPKEMALIMFGHTELLTEEIAAEYVEWCKTDEGRQYLKGGAKYDEEYAKKYGIKEEESNDD